MALIEQIKKTLEAATGIARPERARRVTSSSCPPARVTAACRPAMTCLWWAPTRRAVATTSPSLARSHTAWR